MCVWEGGNESDPEPKHLTSHRESALGLPAHLQRKGTHQPVLAVPSSCAGAWMEPEMADTETSASVRTSTRTTFFEGPRGVGSHSPSLAERVRVRKEWSITWLVFA